MGKTNLTKKEIAAIAELIKIFVPEEELDDYADQLDTALDYTSSFNELDTQDIEITSQSIGVINVFRGDKVTKSLSQEEASLNAVNKENGYIVVQRVVKK